MRCARLHAYSGIGSLHHRIRLPGHEQWSLPGNIAERSRREEGEGDRTLMLRLCQVEVRGGRRAEQEKRRSASWKKRARLAGMSEEDFKANLRLMAQRRTNPKLRAAFRRLRS
eukprot:IDg3828t1